MDSSVRAPYRSPDAGRELGTSPSVYANPGSALGRQADWMRQGPLPLAWKGALAYPIWLSRQTVTSIQFWYEPKSKSSRATAWPWACPLPPNS